MALSTPEVHVEPTINTRMGDGSLVALTRSQIRQDLEAGTQEGAKRSKAPVLEPHELDYLEDLFASDARVVGVPMGGEVVLTFDGTGDPQLGSRVDAMLIYEQFFGADSCELYHMDYSYPAVKTLVPNEQEAMKRAQERLTIPVHYGAQPDLGRYSRPDGPCLNWSELLPQMRIGEARAAQEEAVELAVEDMVRVAEALWEVGADGINFDTAGAAGDADLLATLRAIRTLRTRHPDMGIMLGMASEIVLGMHGELEFDGVRLAGLKPEGQLRVAQEAGATVFGPAVNVNSSRTCAWNVARALTFIKPCMTQARIPIHVNAGMGVGGIPMSGYPPLDAVSRCSRACVEILRCDGL
jgi:dimethylamine--corrinoid protein Co-methyltransferase